MIILKFHTGENKTVLNALWKEGAILDQTTKFNPFPHDTFWGPWETGLLKTLWEKEKLLVMSNFYFSYSVFYPYG